MITYMKYIGTTDSGHFTHNNLYPALGFAFDNGNAGVIVLNDVGSAEFFTVSNWDGLWEIASVSIPGVKQVYPV